MAVRRGRRDDRARGHAVRRLLRRLLEPDQLVPTDLRRPRLRRPHDQRWRRAGDQHGCRRAREGVARGRRTHPGRRAVPGRRGPPSGRAHRGHARRGPTRRSTGSTCSTARTWTPPDRRACWSRRTWRTTSTWARATRSPSCSTPARPRSQVLGVVASAEYIFPAKSRQELFSLPDDFGVLFVPEDAGRAGHRIAPRCAQTLTLYDERRRQRLARPVPSPRSPSTAGADDVTTQEDQPSNAALAEDLQGFSEMAFMFPAAVPHRGRPGHLRDAQPDRARPAGPDRHAHRQRPVGPAGAAPLPVLRPAHRRRRRRWSAC